MIESRAGKYGRFLSEWIGYTINRIPEEQRKAYKTSFLREFRKYSFEGKRRKEPPNKGCTRELQKLTNPDISDPVQLARLVKEGLNLMYQKQTARRVYDAMIAELNE